MKAIVLPELENVTRNLTIDKVVRWTIDFDFLIGKAERDLGRAYSDGILYFRENAINLSVTLDSLCDYAWHTIIKHEKDCTWKTDKDYKSWVYQQDLFISMFIDLSNTFKHFERPRPNRLARHLDLYMPQDVTFGSDDQDEERNLFRYDATRDGLPIKMIVSPRIVFNDQMFSVPFLSAAERALTWWKTYYASII